jgi:hypothetical protein
VKCGKPVPFYAGPGTGEWVAKRPDVKDLEGRLWSQLTSAYNDPADILKEFNDPANANIADTYRLRLGRPYMPKEDQLTEAQVYRCCGPGLMQQQHVGPCAMGVDIGREFHIVIGVRTGKDTFEIVRLARIPCQASAVTMDSAFRAVHDIARHFNVRSACLDLRPYEHQVREFAAAEPYRMILCEYTENALMGNTIDDKKGVMKSYRTGLLDTTHELITERRVTLPARCPEVEKLAEHAAGMAKILEKNKKTGVSVYRYVGPEDDHYRHALGYFWLAASEGRVAKVGGARKGPEKARSEYSVI